MMIMLKPTCLNMIGVAVFSRFCLLYCSVTSEISECEFQMTAAKCLLCVKSYCV